MLSLSCADRTFNKQATCPGGAFSKRKKNRLIRHTRTKLEPSPMTILSRFAMTLSRKARSAVIAVLRPFQRAGEIGDEVGAVFDTDGVADQIVLYANHQPLLGGKLVEAHQRRLLDKAFNPSQ